MIYLDHFGPKFIGLIKVST